MQIVELTGTTDALGALTITSTDNVVGRVEKVVMDYIDGDTGADLTLTLEEAGVSVPVLTKANLGTVDDVFYPRTPANAVADGTAFTNWADKIFGTGTFKAVIAAGGNAKQFRFLIYVSDE